MTYKSQLDKSKKRLYQKAIATKILDMMDKLRMEQNDISNQRWIWELIQNACDTAFAGQGINICVSLQEDTLIFSHNGMPFTAENITFLVEQISSKSRSNDQTTGKFGTGFLSTHALSEIVQVRGYIKEPGYPYKRFELVLDRSGRILEQIIESINQSLAMLVGLDMQPDADFNPENQNTSFWYKLSSKGIKAAKAGLKDLEQALPYVMIFNPVINSVRVNNDLFKLNEAIEDGELLIYTISKESNEVLKSSFIVLLSEQCSIAVPVTNKRIGKPSPHIARLFCRFPLVGTHDLLPVIINSGIFNTNEQRSGIYLTDVDEQQVVENKKLILEAVSLYKHLIKGVSHWKNVHHLCNIRLEKKEWLSADWFSENVIKPVRTSILNVEIVETDEGKKKMSDCMFPWHDKKETRETIWELCSGINGFKLPVKKHINDWHKTNWLTDNRLTLNLLAKWLEEQASFKSLSEALGKSLSASRSWIKKALELLITDESMVYQINQDRLRILPNQKGEFCYSCDLYFDRTSSEELKIICAELGYDYREILMDKHISVKLSLKDIDDHDVADETSKLTEKKLAMIDRDNQTAEALRKLYMWFNLNKDLAEELFPRLYAVRHRLITDDEIAATFQKAKILDDLFNGISPDEIRSTLSQMIRGSSELLIDESSEKTRTSINEEAKQLVIDLLLDQGYKVPELINTDYTFLNGITKPDGTPVTIIVKSALSGKLYLSNREWLSLMKADIELYVLYKAGSVKRLTLNDLLSSNDSFHVRIEPNGLNVQSFLDSFQHLKCKFIFQSPANASDYLKEFRFNTRKT